VKGERKGGKKEQKERRKEEKKEGRKERRKEGRKEGRKEERKCRVMRKGKKASRPSYHEYGGLQWWVYFWVLTLH
jgi:hypothetical protein